MSSIIVSHFLLDLQEAHQRKVVGLATGDPSHTSQSFSVRSLNFMPALGSLAATIEPADYDRVNGNEGVDEDGFGVQSEDFPMRPGVREYIDTHAEDRSAITEVPRSGNIELAVGL